MMSIFEMPHYGECHNPMEKHLYPNSLTSFNCLDTAGARELFCFERHG